jgi:hypothetical protein
LPSSLSGYDHDVFLSFASFDDRDAGGSWVQVLRGRLAAELLHRLGHGALIDATGALDAASRSAVLVVLLSGPYLSKVGTRDLDAFAANAAGRRLVPVLLQEPPPGESWPCAAASPVVFYDTDDVKHGRRHDPGTPGDAQHLCKKLKRFGVRVLGEVPPPWKADEHKDEVCDALGKADLAVHFLGPFPGRKVDGKEESSYPVEQFHLGGVYAPRSSSSSQSPCRRTTRTTRTTTSPATSPTTASSRSSKKASATTHGSPSSAADANKGPRR